jgi:hypothetical protein
VSDSGTKKKARQIQWELYTGFLFDIQWIANEPRIQLGVNHFSTASDQFGRIVRLEELLTPELFCPPNANHYRPVL